MESLEIKGKKQKTPSYFSFFSFDDVDQYMEYSVLANFSENKSLVHEENTLFSDESGISKLNDHSENEFLIAEHKQMNYLFVIRGEMENEIVEELVNKIKEIDIVLTAIRIDANSLKSKQNLIF